MSLYLFSSLIWGKLGISLSIMAGTQVHGTRYSGTRYSVRKGQVLIAGAEQGVWNCGAVGCVPPLDSSAVKVESVSNCQGRSVGGELEEPRRRQRGARGVGVACRRTRCC